MNLPEPECWRRLEIAGHGVLGTVHPRRGVDAVPCVFAVAGGRLAVPIDTVKPKRRSPLRRVVNIQLDPRCVLLVEHYEADWRELWWVRVHADAELSDDPDPWLAPLAARYDQYRLAGAVQSVLVLTPTAVAGWSAAAG